MPASEDGEEWSAPPGPGADQAAIGSLVAGQVRDALGRLPAEQRQALALAYYGGYTQREVAALTGVPLGTVKSRMFTGIARLRSLLGPVVGRVRRGTVVSGTAGHVTEDDEERSECPMNEQTVGWALHALEPDEELAAVEHLDTCAECQSLAADVAEVTSGLAEAVEQHEPPARLRASIVEQAEQTPQVPPSTRRHRPRTTAARRSAPGPRQHRVIA